MAYEEEKVRERSDAEQQAYAGSTIDAATGEETPNRPEEQAQQGIHFYRLDDARQMLEPKNIASYLWRNTTWKTKLVALVATVAVVAGVGLFLSVAIPFLLTVAGAFAIAWFVVWLFMRR